MEEQQENDQMEATAGPSNWKPQAESKSEVPIPPQQDEPGASKTVQERDKIQSMTHRILLDCLHRIIRINTAAMLSDDSGAGLLRETTDAPFTISRHDFYSLFAAYMACVRDKQQDKPDSSNGTAPSHADIDALVDHLNKTNDLSAQKSALPSLASIQAVVEEPLCSSSEAKAETSESAIFTETKEAVAALKQQLDIGTKQLESMQDMLTLAILRNMFDDASSILAGRGRQGKGRAKSQGKGKGKASWFNKKRGEKDAADSWGQMQVDGGASSDDSKEEMALDTEEATSGDDTQVKKKDNPVSRLPREALRRIFELAGRACVDHIEPSEPSGKKPRRAAAKARENKLPMSLEQAQYWLLCLRLVCKAWEPVAKAVVFETLIIEHDGALIDLLQTMHANPDIGGLIKDDVKLNMCIDHSKPGSDEWDHDHSEASLDGSEENSSTGMPSAAAIRSVIKRAEQAIQLKALTAEARAAQFLMLARGVQKLRLHGSWQARGHMHGIASAFMTSSLHDALATSSLQRLELDISIVYIDLELILLGVKTLQTVHLDSGISSGDRRDHVSEIDHQARLESFRIDSITGGGIIGVQQLCWLLRPAVGHLKTLALQFPRHHSGLDEDMDDDEDDDMDAAIQPWASSPFATLLVQLAPTLRHLTMAAGMGSATAAPDLTTAPHAGSLNHALSHCYLLEKLDTAWSVLADGFLDVAAASPSLKSMILRGSDIPISAASFATAISQGKLPSLKTITLPSFKNASVRLEGWNLRDTRRLISLCKEKGIKFAAY